jgi:hypothetical protein
MLEGATDYVLAAGGLGTAAFALVDGSKAFWGGVSNAGFGQIERVVTTLFPGGTTAFDRANPLSLGGVTATLRAHWLNGTALADQRAIAKTLVKLRLDAANAPQLARATGVDGTVLSSIAQKIATGETLSQAETDVLGRFDLILTTLLDEGYQRADQIYRNTAKAYSAVIAVALAFFGGWVIQGGGLTDYVATRAMGAAVLTGLIATPLAPISKDLATGITAAVRAVGALRK